MPAALRATARRDDTTDMERFWAFAVCVPSALLGVLAIVAGATSGVDWSLSLTAAMVLALVCKSGDLLRRRASSRRKRAEALAELAAARRPRPIGRAKPPLAGRKAA